MRLLRCVLLIALCLDGSLASVQLSNEMGVAYQVRTGKEAVAAATPTILDSNQAVVSRQAVMARVVQDRQTQLANTDSTNTTSSTTNSTGATSSTPAPAEPCPAGEGRNVNSNKECTACPRTQYSSETMSDCASCPNDTLTPNDSQSECISRNEASGVPTFVLVGYLGLLMTFSLLSTQARAARERGAIHSKLMSALSTFVFMEIMCMFYMMILPNSFGKNYLALPIVFGLYSIAKATFTITDIKDYLADEDAKEKIKMGVVQTQEKSFKEKAKSFISRVWGWLWSQHGFTLDVISFVLLFVCMFRIVGEKKAADNGGKETINYHLRKADITVMVILQFAIQMQVSALVQNTYETGPKMSQYNLIAILAMMLMHAVLFPVALIIHIRSVPKGKAFTGDENTNVHYVADYFGLMAVGAAVALTILEKAHDATNESADQLKAYGVYADRLKRERQFIDCSGGEGSSADREKYLENKSEKVKTRLYEFLKTEVDDDHRCEIAKRMEPINWKLLTYELDEDEMKCEGVMGVDEKELKAELDKKNAQMNDLSRKCTIMTADIPEDLEQAIKGFVAQKSQGLVNMGSSFGMMMLVADAYYGAVYNVIDMGENMSPQTDIINNTWAILVIAACCCFAWLAGYFVLANKDSYWKPDEEQAAKQCRPMRHNRRARRDECGPGFFYTDTGCGDRLGLTCMRCPATTPFSQGSSPPMSKREKEVAFSEKIADLGHSPRNNLSAREKKTSHFKMMEDEDKDQAPVPSKDRPKVHQEEDCKTCYDPSVRTSCPPGTHYDFVRCTNLYADVCAPCPPGQYNDKPGAVKCKQCAGKPNDSRTLCLSK